MKFGFYLVGEKGYSVLDSFNKEFGCEPIAFVMAARDHGLEYDWYDDICELCLRSEIPFYKRGKSDLESMPKSDFQFAIGWKWMVRPCSNLIVFHDSLLPKYRGFAPLVNMLINGENDIGVTAVIGAEEYDRGEIVHQAKKRIAYPVKISVAIKTIIPLYAELVAKTANDVLSTGKVHSVPQDERSASYSLWRNDDDYYIDWCLDAKSVERFVNAVGPPYRGAAAIIKGRLVRILDVEPMEDVVVENRTGNVGKTIFMDNDCPVVVCGCGLLKIVDARTHAGENLIGHIHFRSRFEGVR